MDGSVLKHFIGVGATEPSLMAPLRELSTPLGRPRTSKGACAIPPEERKRPRRRNTSQPSIRACWLRSIEGLAEEFHDPWYEGPIAHGRPNLHGQAPVLLQIPEAAVGQLGHDGLLATGIRCLLLVCVKGRSRVPRPPAVIKAFIAGLLLFFTTRAGGITSERRA